MARPEIILQPWADGAETTIPPTPISGTTYRDTALNAATIDDAWPFDNIVNSPDTNQFIYLLSKILKQVEEGGIIQWSELIDYTEIEAWVRGTDGEIYVSLQTPNLNQDPISEPTFWELLKTNLGVGEGAAGILPEAVDSKLIDYTVLAADISGSKRIELGQTTTADRKFTLDVALLTDFTGVISFVNRSDFRLQIEVSNTSTMTINDDKIDLFLWKGDGNITLNGDSSTNANTIAGY